MMLLKPKSSKLERAERRRERQIAKRREKRIEDILKRTQDAAIRKLVYIRDLGLCRVCGACVDLRAYDPLKQAQVHHIIYRSAGGSSALSNLVTLCIRCHDEEHRHIISIDGTADKLKVTRIVQNQRSSR